MEKYSLLKVIGEGSFGRAVLVRCKDSQEQYVVKEIQLPKVRENRDGDGVDPPQCSKSFCSNNNNHMFSRLHVEKLAGRILIQNVML